MLFSSDIGGIINSLTEDLGRFSPELILCGAIVLLLILRLFRGLQNLHLGYVALVAEFVGLWLAYMQWVGLGESGGPKHAIFSGMLVYDGLTVFMRMFLLGSTALVTWLSLLTGIPDREDSADFFSLLLGATLGMMLMASANHLLMVYIAIEMASLPSYALAGFLKGRRQSSEAALKYVVYGGAASGVMLYGISLLAGRFGTAYLPEVASSFVTVMQQSIAQHKPAFDPVLALGLLTILIGLAFKLSAVPFHFWCPDVFEGAAAEVAGFLSVASKGAAIALVGRFSLTFAGLASDRAVDFANWELVGRYLGVILAVFAAVTATFGNLAAYAQTNLKRLLAYSTIAHAGYMMMALATLTREGLEAALYYLVAYLFMNLGAFAVVAFIRNRTGEEDLSGYGGMVRRNPLLTVAFAIFLLNLLGLPPFVGFWVKFNIFAVLYDTGREFGSTTLYALLAIGLINTVLSLVYYVRALKVMILDAPPAGASAEVTVPTPQSFYAGLLAAVVTIGMLFDVMPSVGEGKEVRQFQRVQAAQPAGAPQVTLR